MNNSPTLKCAGIVNVMFGKNVTVVEPANLYGCIIGDDCFVGPFVEIQTGVKIGHVPYKGVTGAITDMVGGQIDLMFIGLGTVSALVKAGKLRILATASEARLPALPEVATMSETLPGFTAGGWFGVVSSPMTPPAIANRLSLAIRELIKHPEVQNFMNELNVQGVGSTPEEMAALARREGERWGKLIRATGIVAE